MHAVTIYQDKNQALTIVEATPPQEVDAAFLATWLHGKSEKTQRAYAADIRKFYMFVGLPLAELRLADFHAWIDSLAALSPAVRHARSPPSSRLYHSQCGPATSRSMSALS